MKRFWALLAALLLCLPACASASGCGTALVDGKDADRVHLRAAASTGAASLGLYFTGTTTQLLEEPGGEWTSVQIGTQTGYMMGQYLAVGEDALSVIPRWPSGRVVHFGAEEISLRCEPDESSAPLAQLYGPCSVTVLGETADGWCYVRDDRAFGYLPSACVTIGRASVYRPSTAQVETLTAEIAGLTTVFELTALGENDVERLYGLRVIRGGETLQTLELTGDPISLTEHPPLLHLTDVNMDGYPDLSFLDRLGASDGFATHYLYDPATGTFAFTPELSRLSWYRCTLYPQQRVIVNYLHDSALTGRWEICRWEGNSLVLLATASITDNWESGGDLMTAEVIRYERNAGSTVYLNTWAGDDMEAFRRTNALRDQIHRLNAKTSRKSSSSFSL